MLLGVQMAELQGWDNIILETNCLRLVNTLNNGDFSVQDTGFVLQDIKEHCSHFTSYCWVFTRRANNVFAHELAAFNPSKEFLSQTWWEDFPDFLSSGATRDCNLLHARRAT